MTSRLQIWKNDNTMKQKNTNYKELKYNETRSLTIVETACIMVKSVIEVDLFFFPIVLHWSIAMSTICRLHLK